MYFNECKVSPDFLSKIVICNFNATTKLLLVNLCLKIKLETVIKQRVNVNG